MLIRDIVIDGEAVVTGAADGGGFCGIHGIPHLGVATRKALVVDVVGLQVPGSGATASQRGGIGGILGVTPVRVSHSAVDSQRSKAQEHYEAQDDQDERLTLFG
jgi:hypothetical protein